jgi:hypothetical protein
MIHIATARWNYPQNDASQPQKFRDIYDKKKGRFDEPAL